MATTRKQTPTQARKSALESDFATLYALAGLTDAFAAQVKTALAETKAKASERVSKLQGKPAELEQQAKASAEELARFWRELPEQAKALPDSTKARLAEFQRQAETLLGEVGGTYGDLAGRGKRVVDGAVSSARRLSTKAEQRAGHLAADVAERVDPAFEKVQETVTLAREQVTGHTATKTVTPRSSLRSTATRAAKVQTTRAQAAKTGARKPRTTKATATTAPAAKTRTTRKAAGSNSAAPQTHASTPSATPTVTEPSGSSES